MSGRSVVVTHNDFGPGKAPAARGVIIDLSPAAFDLLGGKRGITKNGTPYGEIPVVVTPIETLSDELKGRQLARAVRS